jgi:hypothetical protein
MVWLLLLAGAYRQSQRYLGYETPASHQSVSAFGRFIGTPAWVLFPLRLRFYGGKPLGAKAGSFLSPNARAEEGVARQLEPSPFLPTPGGTAETPHLAGSCEWPEGDAGLVGWPAIRCLRESIFGQSHTRRWIKRTGLMADIIKQLQNLIAERRRIAVRASQVRTHWNSLLPALLTKAKGLCATFVAALAEDEMAPHASAGEGALVLRFLPPPWPHVPDRVEPEQGAQAHFFIDDEGQLCEQRWPYAEGNRRPSSVRLVVADTLQNAEEDVLGAIVDFLGWASIGKGGGLRSIRFRVD